MSDVPPWEGREVASLSAVGFRKANIHASLARTGTTIGSTMSRRLLFQAIKELRQEGSFEDVEVLVGEDPSNPVKVTVTVLVKEK